MSNLHSDALVFFGATGDLAYKKIFPALQAMVKRGHLNRILHSAFPESEIFRIDHYFGKRPG